MTSAAGNLEATAKAKPLTPGDYRLIRRGLLLEFWGLLYFPLLSILLAVLGSSQPLWPIFLSGICYLLVLAGIVLLLRVSEEGLFRLFLGLAGSAYMVSGALQWAMQWKRIPGGFEKVSDLLFSGAALMFVLGLRRLVSHTHWWEGVLHRLRTDVLLVATFWVGWDVLALAMSFSSGRGLGLFQHLGLLFLLLVARIFTLVHIWGTLKAIHQDAGLRNNVLVIRGRRNRTKTSGPPQPRRPVSGPSGEDGGALPPAAGA